MKKVAFLIVPHQDDEINLAGNILEKLQKIWEVMVIYSSLDANKRKAEIRKKEALNACSIFNIPANNIIFLGYPDTPNCNGNHFYCTEQRGIENDLKKLILKYRPEVVMGTDFDYHSDHRMLSLALDRVIGQIIRSDTEYRPIVLKGFCYETAYYGIEDYSASNLGLCNVYSENLSNASFLWNDRISIKGTELNGLIWHKKAFKALAKHKSQYAVLHARSVINADNVFWQKRTDNLMFDKDTDVVASSGSVEKLRDFLIIDTTDIITHDPQKIDYSCALWIPNEFDKDPFIEVQFIRKKTIQTIILHGNPNEQKIYNVKIIITIEKKTYMVKELQPFGRATLINIGGEISDKIKFDISSHSTLSEIEVLEKDYDKTILLDINSIKVMKKGQILDYIDKVGYGGIAIWAKIKRKFQKTKYLWANIGHDR